MTVGAQNFPTCAATSPTPHTQIAHFQHQRSAFFKITKNTKSHFLLSSFCSAVRCRVPQSVTYRGWYTHRQADRPLPHLAAAAPTLPVATRKTTRLSRQSPLLFVQNAPLFVPSPHAGDTTRALASALQSRCISCLHPSPSPYPIDIQMLTRELHPHFLHHRGEGKGGEAFTLITLLSNDLRTIGEEVKAKNEKRRTRPRARKTPKRQLDCTSILGVRHLGCATRTTRSKD